MRKCHFCKKDIQDASRVCEHCGRDLVPHAPPLTREITRDAATWPIPTAVAAAAGRPASAGSSIFAGVLVAVALLSAAGGVASLSNATAGVGGIAFACFLGILARVVQAERHHAALVRVLSERPSPAAP